MEMLFYRTRDRFEIYSLMASGVEIDGSDRDGNAVYFRFKDKEKCEYILAQLLSKKLKVYAHEFINAIRDAQAIFYK